MTGMSRSTTPEIVANKGSMNLRVNDPNLTWVLTTAFPEAGQSTADLNSKEDSLVTIVTEGEVMGPATSGNIASVLNNILAGGLNEQPTKRRKENIHRPSSSKLLAQTRVNPENWDIARKQARSMDSRLQAL